MVPEMAVGCCQPLALDVAVDPLNFPVHFNVKTVFPKLLLTLTGFTLTLRQNRVVEGRVTISQLSVVFSINSDLMAREHLNALRRTFLEVVICSAASVPDLYQKKKFTN